MITPRLRQLLLFSVTATGLALANVGSPAVARPTRRRWAADAHSAVRLDRRRDRHKGRATVARRRRNQARARVEDLLALSRRFRRAAALRFCAIEKCEIGDRVMAGAAALLRRQRQLDRLQGRRDLAAPRSSPQNAGQPVQLALKLDYAICEKLCMPVEATRGAALDRRAVGPSTTAALARPNSACRSALGSARARPRSAPFAATRAAQRPRVTVDVAAPAERAVDLFAEGPTPDWALPLPEPAPAPDGSSPFHLRPRRPAAGRRREGSELRFTLVAPARAIEVTTHLD